jgi:TatA/E family protein of Tat protein translocase
VAAEKLVSHLRNGKHQLRAWVVHAALLNPEESMFEGMLQPMHLLVIFGIALLVFGPKKLPEMGKGIGEGIRLGRGRQSSGDYPQTVPWLSG